MEVRLTVNELSKLVGISKRNIRYYDQIELFKPSGVLENGYRYYTVDKIEEINSIVHLRHLGISIKEIKKLMDKRDIKTYDEMLNKHIEKVGKEIDNLMNIKNHLNKRLKVIKTIETLPPYGEIHIKEIDELTFVKVNQTIKCQGDWELSVNNLIEQNNLPYGIFVGDLGFFVDLKEIQTRAGEDFIGMFLICDQSHSDEVEIIKGKCLSVYIRGGHHEAKIYYKKLVEYAKVHHLLIENYAMEKMLVDHYITANESEHITEIIIPIIEK